MKPDFEKLVQSRIKTPEPEKVAIEYPDQKISSVIMPFYEMGGEYGVLLTKRSELLKNHPGQVSFPGGKFSKEDGSLYHTALREWEEETGEKESSIELISPFHSIITRTGYYIAPFVTRYRGGFNFNVNPNEVDFILKISLHEFLEMDFYAIQIPGKKEEFAWYFDHPRALIWGATCEILVNFFSQFCNFKRSPKLVLSNLNRPPFLDLSKLKN